VKRLLLLSAVHNEAATLERVAKAVATQTRRPEKWIIVDDGSTDATPAILRRLRTELPWLLISARSSSTKALRMRGSAPARALNGVLRELDLATFAYIGVLDGDIELGPGLIEVLLAELDRDPALGLVGADLVEPTRSGWQRLTAPAQHVHGGVRVYRRECLEALLPLPEVLGWDSVDQAYARLQGFETRTLASVVARHHRPWGTANGRVRGRMRYGASAYAIGQPPAWALLRAGKIAVTQALGPALAFLIGYGGAMLRRAPKVEDEGYRRFVRAELRARLGAMPIRIRAAIRPSRHRLPASTAVVSRPASGQPGVNPEGGSLALVDHRGSRPLDARPRDRDRLPR
jgi:glycosyltransferase involved in cell wall biosynthesis